MTENYAKESIVESVIFTEENKDIIFNSISCNKAPDFENGKPVLKIQTPEGIKIVRIGDWILKRESGEYCTCKPEAITQKKAILQSTN
jgi:hypothetical protein